MTIAMRTVRLTIGIIVGITLFGILPMSVFSQTEAVTTASPEDAIQSEETVVTKDLTPAELGYSVEHIGSNDAIGDFVVGPGKVELTIKPGESRTVEIATTNRMGDLRQFNLEVEDATGSADPEKSIILLGDERGPYTLRDYISFPTEHYDLKNGERARIPVTISIPADAEPGGRYGSVLVTTVSKQGQDGTVAGAAPASAVVTRVGTLFFITIPGDIETGGEFKKFATIPNKSWFDKGPIHFELLFENTGSVHLNPYGEIRITNMMGDEVGAVELEPWFALPKSLRFREVVWNREFLFGRYTAEAYINRGYDNIIDVEEFSFWVLPWQLTLGILVAIFITLFLIRAFFRTFEFKRKGS